MHFDLKVRFNRSEDTVKHQSGIFKTNLIYSLALLTSFSCFRVFTYGRHIEPNFIRGYNLLLLN